MYESWFTSDKYSSASEYSVIITLIKEWQEGLKSRTKEWHVKRSKVKSTTRIREIMKHSGGAGGVGHTQGEVVYMMIQTKVKMMRLNNSLFLLHVFPLFCIL